MHTCMSIINLLDSTWSFFFFTFVEACRLPSLILLVNIFPILIFLHMNGYHKKQYHHAIIMFPGYKIHHYFYSNIIVSLFHYISRLLLAYNHATNMFRHVYMHKHTSVCTKHWSLMPILCTCILPLVYTSCFNSITLKCIFISY